MTRRFMCFALVLVILTASCTVQSSPGSAVTPQLPVGSQAASTVQGPPAVAITQSPTALPTLEVLPGSSPTAPIVPTQSRTASPAASPSSTPTSVDCSSESGRVVSASLETSLLRLPLVYRVYLPPCYDAHSKDRYPSLYLFHGQSYTDDQWDRMGVDETADRLISAGEIAPLIIVMPYERYGGQPTETGFSDAVVKQLIPTIDETYRTQTGRRFRAVGGLSRGAGWAIHFGIAYWKLFGRLGAHSAAVFHTDAQRMRTWLGKIPADQFPQVYLDIGDHDRPEIMRSTVWFEDLLNSYDIPHEWHLFSGYHSETYWSEHIEDYLLWYTRDW